MAGPGNELDQAHGGCSARPPTRQRAVDDHRRDPARGAQRSPYGRWSLVLRRLRTPMSEPGQLPLPLFLDSPRRSEQAACMAHRHHCGAVATQLAVNGPDRCTATSQKRRASSDGRVVDHYRGPMNGADAGGFSAAQPASGPRSAGRQRNLAGRSHRSVERHFVAQVVTIR